MLNLYAIKYRVGKEIMTIIETAEDAIKAELKAKRKLEAKHGAAVEILEVREIR